MESPRSCEIVAVIDDVHGDCVKTARPFVREACISGVTGIKLIACSPEHYATRRLLNKADPYWPGRTYRESLQRLQLTPETMVELREATEGLQLIIAPYDLKSFDSLANETIDVWQIDPGCNTNIPLLESVAALARRIYFCTWGCSPREVERALSVCGNAEVVLIHSLRQTSAHDLMNDMATLRWLQGLGYPIGCYDDHLDAYPTCLGLAMGVQVIEKPLCPDTTAIGHGPVSSELVRFVQSVRTFEQAMRSGPTLVYRPEDLDNVEDKRAALVTTQFVPRGTLLTRDMLAVKAPALGLASELLPFVLGRRVLYDLEESEPITFGVIA